MGKLLKATSAPLIFVLTWLTACGGGGMGSNLTPSQGNVSIVSGNHQSTFSGGMLLQPIDVSVSWGSDTTSQVTFTSSPGVTVFPSQVTVAPDSVLKEARALVRLPDTPFSTFSITAAASTGGSVQFSASTGPRLVKVFGNASGYNGAVAADGTYFDGGAGGDVGGGAIFNSDGTLRTFLGSSLGKLNVLDSGAGQALVTPDQKLYFNHGDYVEGFDTNMNLLSFADIQSQAKNRPPPIYRDPGDAQWLTVDSAGNLYGMLNQQIEVYDPQGVVTRTINIDPYPDYFGIAVNSSGDVVVALYENLTAKLREYDSNNVPTDHDLPTSYLRGLTQDSKGNYVIDQTVSVVVMSQQYETLETISSLSPAFDGLLSGIDDLNNAYFMYGGGISKFDSNGDLIWMTALPEFSPTPPGLTNPIYVSPFFGNNVGDGGMAVNHSNGDVYIQNSVITIFSQGVYRTSFSQAVGEFGNSIALDSNGNVYVPYGYDSLPEGIAVYDSSGNSLNSIILPQLGVPSGIAIDSTDTKFVFDIKNQAIHQVDSQDNYVGSIKVNVSSSTTIDSAGIGFDPSGNLVVCLATTDSSTSTNPGYLKKISRAGTELWSMTIGASSSPVRNVALDSAGQIYLLRSQALEIRDPSGNFLAQVDLDLGGGGGDDRLIPMAADGDQIYFYFAGRIFVVSPS